MTNNKRSLSRCLLAAAGLWLLSSEIGLAASVEVTDAWARATMPGQAVAGVYLHVKSAVKARLVGVKSSNAKTAEIHSMSHESGVMKMRKLDFLDLPAGEAVALEPGGNHVMLFDIRKPLKAGEHVKLTLVIEQGGKRINVPVDAEVRALTDQH
jgi:copper(I)-binding protein